MRSKPVFIIAILLVFYHSSFAQISDYLESSRFDWTYWEVFRDDAAKKQFLVNSGFGSMSMDQTRVIDIDGNQVADIISMPQGNKVTIMINDGSGFQTLLDLDETLMMIGRPKPWHPIFLLTKKDNCCEAGYYSLNYYRPGYDKSNKLVFVLDKSVVVKNDVELISENLPPFRFELKVDLSLQAKADPASPEIGQYKTSSTGYAVASKTGSDGKTWWLVLMPYESHSLKAGWMPSTDLKRKF